MIRVTVELVPFGIEADAKEIGKMLIANDGTGDYENGNYVGVYDSDIKPKVETAIIGFTRSQGVWELIKHVIEAKEEVGGFREPLRKRLVERLE